jgi:protocatechuate 3,4-dioxygenase beta subunit
MILLFAIGLILAQTDDVEMRIRALDEAGKPIAGAKVHLSIWSESKKPPNTDYTTGADGVAITKRPKELGIIRVWVSAPGYADLFRGWETGKHENGKLIPTAFDFPMRKATTAGGRIVDARGKGIHGARVEVNQAQSSDETLPNEICYPGTLAWGKDAAVTDKEGRWSIANVPPKTTKMSLKVTHPDYNSDVYFGEHQDAQGVSIAQILTGTSTIKLEPGARLSGRVTDADGKPIPKAMVIWDDEPYRTPGSQELLTDADGKYTVPTLKPSKKAITIVAKGFQPQRRVVDLKLGAQTADFKLEKGKRLRVQVVDAQGKPLKAYVSIREWQGAQSLYNVRHPNVLPTDIPDRTNDAGLFEWTWAPNDAVTFEVYVKGLQSKKVAFTASEATTERVVLRATPTVSGKVTDTKTGKPIERFEILRVNDFGRGTPRVERGVFTSNARRVVPKDGSYRVELAREDVDYLLLIEADGYRGAISRRHLLKDGVTTVDFQLEPAAPIKGRVLDAKGAPIAGAKVAMATDVQIYEFPDGGGNHVVQTNAQSEYSLPAPHGKFALFAEHANGFVRQEFAKDSSGGDLTLQPWAKVSGKLWQDGKTVSNQHILLSPLQRSHSPHLQPQIDLQMKTESDGRFNFSRVPPGSMTLRAYLGPWNPSPMTSSECVALDLKPGETSIDLGKNGATLVGKLDLEGEIPKGLDWQYSINWLTRKTPDVNVSGATTLERPGQALSSEALLKAHRRFYVKPTPDGRFRIGGVPAGDYWLSFQVYEKPDG